MSKSKQRIVGGIAVIAIFLGVFRASKESGIFAGKDANKGGDKVQNLTETSSQRERRTVSSRTRSDDQDNALVDRLDPQVRKVIALLQESELRRTSESQDISDTKETCFSFIVETPSRLDKKELLKIVRKVRGMTLGPTIEKEPWHQHLAKSYGLYDDYPRQITLARRNGENIVRFSSTILITPDEIGDSLGGSVELDEHANEPQAWRYSHLMTMEKEADLIEVEKN